MSEELATVKGIVDLTPDEALDRAQAFLVRQGYRPVHRVNTRLTVDRFRPNHVSGGEAPVLSVTASPQPGGGVKIAVEGNDGEGLQERQAKWIEWAESLPKKEPEKQASSTAPDPQSAGGDSATETEREEPTLEAKGTDGQVELLPNRVRIRRKGFFWAMGKGGDKEIPYRQLASLKFKSGFTGGYIYFVLVGQEDNQGYLRPREYEVLFDAGQREQFEEIKRAIEQRMEKRQGPAEVLANTQPRAAISSATEAPEKTSASPDAPGQQPGDPGRGTGTEREFHGTTVEEAVAVASAALGVKEEEISFEVVDRGSRGFSGAGERHARIKLKMAGRSGEERGSVPSKSEEAEGDNGTQAGADEEDHYYTPGQAAQLLDKDAYEINQMIYQEKLPVIRVNDYRWISAQAVENLLPRKSRRRLKKAVKPHRVHMPEKKKPEEENPLTDLTSPQESGHHPTDSAPAPKASSPGSEKFEEIGVEGSEQEVAEPQNAIHNLIGVLKDLERERSEEKDVENESSLLKRTDASAQRVKELEDEVRALRVALRADSEYWERELEREREGRKQDNLDARYEIDQLDAELENLRRDDRVLRAELKQERFWRAESERWAEELQAELEIAEERARRLATEESLNPTDSKWHEREEYEERLAALNSELEEERKRRPRKEEWALGLQSRLEESEAEKKALEETLFSEKEKARRLEAEKRLLDEVKRLLGAAGAEEQSEPDKETIPENVTEDETSGELLLKTPFGQVSFLPPFPLNEQEVELLRLIAREDELTGEQIQKQMGRRRAHPDFEYLLERLADEGVKLVEEVSEDRYRFNPTTLQND